MKKGVVRIFLAIVAYGLIITSVYLTLCSRTGWNDLPCATVHPFETTRIFCSKVNFTTRRFVLALDYWEQLTMATVNLFSLVHVAHNWGALTVVPFTLHSKLFGLPATNRRKFDVLFNISEINRQMLCDKYNLPPLAGFQDFVKMADRSVVFVHVAWAYKWFGIVPKDSGRIGIGCSYHSTQEAESVLRILNQEARRMCAEKFRITRHCCINPYVGLTTVEIADTCDFADTNSTLIFDLWRGHHSHVMKDNYRLMFPGIQITTGQPHCDSDVFPCSQDIRSNATVFTQSFSHGKQFIAFHFRATKLGMKGKEYTDTCMKNAFALRDNLTKAYPEVPIKYFVDYGDFGAKDGNAKEVVIPYIDRDTIIPLHYDPAVFGGLRDSGFVSLVEKSAIAKAKILVLVGGGSFQAELRKRMQTESASERIYYVCKDGSTEQQSLDIHH